MMTPSAQAAYRRARRTYYWRPTLKHSPHDKTKISSPIFKHIVCIAIVNPLHVPLIIDGSWVSFKEDGEPFFRLGYSPPYWPNVNLFRRAGFIMFL